ncbi:iron-containing redox enzyme family protein [Streptomyces avicenniae]|uniref:iron-containing redox enzyme family protein n=1 Tax=Streptomyces avicenniae TaxID=500153 RepID=UPI00069A78D4|nr:iron-containing redox enzyme family protein [Streptomyces avicenniae]
MTLRGLLDVLRPDLQRAASGMWRSVGTVEAYRRWLLTSYDLVRATAPLLAEALAESVRRGETRLAWYFAEQVVEETGHDVWLAEDHAAAGGDPRALEGRVPSPAVARLAGAQYYYVRHAHPVALLGHIAVLEWNPPLPEAVERLTGRLRLPPDAFRTLTRHAELDVGHGAALERLLAELPLDEQQRRLVVTSALASAQGLVDLLADLTPPPRPAGGPPPGAAPCQDPQVPPGPDQPVPDPTLGADP